jgi:hypothetical protein
MGGSSAGDNCTGAGDEDHGQWADILDRNTLSLTFVVLLLVFLTFILSW